MKILLCEDDPNIATIARLALEQIGGHQVVWANDGGAALKLGTEENFDLILLDDMMPKMSGVEVCKAYLIASANSANSASGASKKQAPVIFISANSQEKNVKELSPVAVGYISKPFDPMNLNQQIVSILKGELKKAV